MPEYVVKLKLKSSDKAVVVKTYQPTVSDAENDAKKKHPGSQIISVSREGAAHVTTGDDQQWERYLEN
jgi:hypothetical protein